MKNTLGRTVGSAFAAWAFGLLSFALLSACGDDNSTGSGSRTSGKETVYADVDDLPECTATNAESLVDVAGDYYTCAAKKWEEVLEVAKGVCNIRPCDKSTEGKWIYAYSAGTAYQCKSGAWKDAAGKTFDELEFVGCFMDALVKDSVASADDLKSCTENKEGDIFVVGKNIVACYSKNWVEVSGGVVSEGDLPDCSGNGFIYVMGKMAVYQCKEGVWYGGGKAVTPSKRESSSSAKPATTSSSSGTKTDDSSSSSKPVSSAAIEDDGTKVRGVCQVSKKAVEKGESVTYSFYNMGGTIVSYTWDFGENASATTSDASSPEVSFSRGGTQRAKLVLNKGRQSESDEIVCPAVTVEAVPVTGCTCTTDATGMILREGRDVNATWTVSGCTGEAPFTYEWSNGASGTGTSALGSPETTGNYAPVVTVTNSDGGTMEPVCKTVPVMEPLRASCSIGNSSSGDYFSISSIVGISDRTPSVDFTLVSASDGVSQNVTVDAQYFEYEDRYMWSWTSKSVKISPSDYALYALMLEGDTVCSASAATCSPNLSTTYRGNSMSWNLLLDNLPIEANSYQWTFTDQSGNVIWTSDESVPEFAPDVIGMVSATLKLDAGLSTESNLRCSGVNVQPRPITGCTCGEPELISESDDLSEVDAVSYRWTVTGCSSNGAEPLSYDWDDGLDVNTEPTKATGSFDAVGIYAPTIRIENIDGKINEVVCGKGYVFADGSLGYVEAEYLVNLLNSRTLGAGKYIINGCDDYYTDRARTWYLYSSPSEAVEWFESQVSIQSEWSTGGMLYVSYPVQLNIPDGKSMEIQDCF